MIKEIEIVSCGKNAAEAMCGGVSLAFIDYNKKGLMVNSVFTESGKQCKSTEEALAYIKKMTEKFVKSIIA